ncbi:Ankyrin repeat domain-containing protein 6 [Hondaea fermentalgiana]|uniref:Ankyrin repeat domain-containing protein 6 n=1 Tax=Hondaea fermentalgiana TaxID=2315210 RepID=A0A2R5H1H5_9STRA|nr:Ankyrin repeat domain-containing protein 6 [Hondaea fermentalgiana]|eukprot:GBG34933.1 Ankyrin repeat domain-containing protein 6 [Hondaea fermentalgiana]
MRKVLSALVVLGVTLLAAPARATPDEDLVTAAVAGDVAGATSAIANGADVNYAVEDQVPVLALCSTVDVAEVLLTNDNIDKNFAPDTNSSFAAVHIFASRANTDLVNALISTSPPTPSPTSVLNVDQLEGTGKSALMLAAGATSQLLGSPVDTADALLQAGADATLTVSSTGNTAIHFAVAAKPDTGVADTRVALLEKLMNHGASVTTKNDDGSGALHVASQPNVGSGAVVQAVLAASAADINVADTAGDYPVHLALRTARETNAATAESILSALLTASPDLTVTGSNGQSPLHLGVASGQVELVTALVNAGARDNVVDSSGGLAIHEAAAYFAVTAAQCSEITAIAQILVENGEADLDATNTAGETALEIAETAPEDRRCISLEQALGSSVTSAPTPQPTPAPVETPSAATSLRPLSTFLAVLISFLLYKME